MVVFLVSACTLKAGLRFPSRALRGEERRLVVEALELWRQWGQFPKMRQSLALMLQQDRLRAMALEPSAGSRERSAYGYSDEHGRILLNPSLCFLSLKYRGTLDMGDRVATLSTMIHEGQHHLQQASEEFAYRGEWMAIRSLRDWATSQGRAELAQELRLWEVQMPRRMADYAW